MKKVLEAIANSFYRTEKPEYVEGVKTVEYMPTDDQLESDVFATLPPVEQYQKAKKYLTYSVEELGKMLPKDDRFKEHCEDLATRVKADELRIGLFGLTGAGKSTFINALLGAECMRMGYGETTRIITEIRCADEMHPCGSIELEYKTIDELNYEIENDLNLDFGEIGENFSIADKNTRHKLKEWAEGVEDPDDSAFVEAVIAGWDNYHDRLGTQVQDAVGSPEDNFLHTSKGENLAVFVKKRKLYFNAPFLIKDMVLLDTPGFGSGVKRHTRLAIEMAKKLDVILLLDKVMAPVMGEEKSCIHDLFENNQTGPTNTGGAQFICILNQISNLPPDESTDEQITRFKERLGEIGIKDVQIFGIDAAQAFWAKLKKASGTLSPENEEKYTTYCKCGSFEKDYQQSRFNDIEGKLPQYLMNNKFKNGYGRKVSEYISLKNAMRDHFAQKLHGITISYDEANEKKKCLENQVQKCERELFIFRTENLNKIILTTGKQFITQFNLEDSFLDIFHNEIKKYGRILFPNEKNQLYSKINSELRDKLVAMGNKLKATYITMRDEILKQRIERIIHRDWPNFTIGMFDETLEINENRLINLQRVILPSFWNMLLHYFNYQENFDNNFKKVAMPKLLRCVEDCIGEWAEVFFDDAKKQFETVAKSQLLALCQAVVCEATRKKEKIDAETQLTCCLNKLEELDLKMKPIEEYLRKDSQFAPCNIASLELLMQDKNNDLISRHLTIDNKVVELPPLKNLGDALALYEDQWKSLSISADEAFIGQYSKKLDDLLAWGDVDQELAKDKRNTGILQVNLSPKLAGLPFELLAKSCGRKYTVLRKIVIKENTPVQQTSGKNFLLISSDDNPPNFLRFEVKKLRDLCQQEGWNYKRFTCKGANWKENLKKDISQATIVHFAGHGKQTEKTSVFVLNQECNVGPEIFKGLPSVPKMLWMNNCYGGDTASNGFVETAASMGIPIVVGSSVRLKDLDVWSFPAGIYFLLFTGKTIGQTLTSLSTTEKPVAELSIYADASAILT